MRFEQLRYLITLSHNPSITSASQELYLTPSALSTAIKNLEKELGITLINRTHTGISLTEAGKKLVKTSQRFLLDIDNIIKDAAPEAFSAVVGNVHFYGSYGALHMVLPKIMCLFYQAYPLISVTTTQLAVNEIFEVIKKNPEEFALLYVISGQDFHGLSFHPYFNCYLLLQINPANPLARYKKIAFKTILEQTIVVHTTCDFNASFCHKLFNKYGYPKKVIFENNAKLCEEMIASDIAIGLSLETPLQNHSLNAPNFACVYIKDLPKFEFGYLLNPEADLTLPSEIFLRYLTTYLTENINPAYLLR